MASLNITSLPAHIDELRIWVENQNLDLLAINETRLASSIPDSCVTIKGYKIIRKDRNRNGGGVAIYIRDSVVFVNHTDIVPINIEALCVDIVKPSGRPFCVIACYKPPNVNAESFYGDFEALVKMVENKELHILGDLNSDLLQNNSYKPTRLLQYLCELYQLKQLISEPTRITEHSQTLIDIICTNSPERIVCSGVLHTSLSDHCTIYAIRKISIPIKKVHTIIETRNYKHFSEETFTAELSNVDWESITQLENPNDIWFNWKEKFLSIVNKHAPIKKKRIRNKRSPWLNKDICKLLFDRDKLKSTAIRSGDSQDWASYKRSKNIVTNKIKKAKSKYYHDQLKDNSNNPSETWKILNEVMCKNNKSGNKISCLNLNDTKITDADEIAETFNKYFCEIGYELSSGLPETRKSYTEFVNPATCTFSLKTVNTETVLKFLKDICPKKAAGLDKIPSKLVRMAASVIAESLCILFNKSILTGIFPSDWKIAKVSPVHKGNEKDFLTNYRPISVLSAVSKVLEKIVYLQLYSYFTNNNLLSKYQSGFRPLHSTLTALLDATTEWYINMDKKAFNSVLFLDLSKAFDTVNHSILLHKLSLYGVDDNALRWFTSYLTDRKQQCYVNSKLSSQQTINCGVPQGSILGPLLFLIYINDLPHCLQHSNARMYADDTNITTSGKSLTEISYYVNKDLSNIRTWLLANKLSLNVAKTEHMFIGSDDKLSIIEDKPYAFIDGIPVRRVKCTKSLGMHIDERLSWDDHINYTSRKVSSAIGGLKQVRPFISEKTAILIYKSLILPYFDYCDIVWDHFSAHQATRLQKLQNRAARVITKHGYEVRSHDIRIKLGWKTLSERRIQHRAIMMYKALNGLAPSYIVDLFKPLSEYISYSLRSRDMNLHLPKPRTDFLKNSFMYSGAKLWNDLSSELKSKTTLHSFKNHIASFGPL